MPFSVCRIGRGRVFSHLKAYQLRTGERCAFFFTGCRGLRECSALRFSLSEKRQERHEKNSGGTERFQCRRTLRVTVEEETQDCGIRRAAPACLWPVYTRRLFFGGRPIVARADETIREHCRLRGLLKHHFALSLINISDPTRRS